MYQACNSSNKSSGFHLQTPGTAIARGLTNLFNGPLRNWHPTSIPGDVNDPAQLAKLRELQFKGLGTVVDAGLGVGLVGLGIGLLRHRKKVEQARKELDTLESTRGTVRFPAVKQANAFGEAIVWLLTSPWEGMRAAYRGMQEVNLRDAGRFDTPLGMLPKGWAVPALALGVPAMAVAGDRIADRITDAERQRMVEARKNKLRQQFNTLLTTPEAGVKAAACDDSCAALLNFLAPRAADMIDKGAGLEMQPSTKALGALYTWWLLSGMLAYTAASKFTKRRDPGLAEQKALDKFEATQQATEPVTLRLSPGAGMGQRRVAGGNPFPVAFPTYKQAWWPGASGGNAWGMDWAQDIKDKGFIGNDPSKGIGNKALSFGRGARAIAGSVGQVGETMAKNPGMKGTEAVARTALEQSGMNADNVMRVGRMADSLGGALGAGGDALGGMWSGLKQFGSAAWQAIQAAFPKAIDWLRNKKQQLGANVSDIQRKLAPSPVPGNDPAAVVPGTPMR